MTTITLKLNGQPTSEEIQRQLRDLAHSMARFSLPYDEWEMWNEAGDERVGVVTIESESR